MNLVRVVAPVALALSAAPAIAQSQVWQPLLPLAGATQPTARRSPAMAYDSHRDRIVMVGGRINQSGSNIYPQETWEFDGRRWELISNTGPVAFGGYNDETNIAAYYDSQRQVTVAIESRQTNNTTYVHEWNGTSWVTTVSLPQSVIPWRFSFEVAYDPVRGRGVMFGGSNTGVEYGDTWEYDGTSLFQVSGFGPMPRWGHAMTFDASRNVVVLSGGRNGPGIADMWDWDGNLWTPSPNSVGGPGARSFHEICYDEARSRLVLIGGDYGPAFETWEWHPSTGWSLTPALQYAAENMKSVYDSTRQRIVMFGGSGITVTTGPTATFGYGEATHSASATHFGAGCAGPVGVPSINAASLPTMGTTFTAQIANLPTGWLNAVFGFVGFDATVWNGVPLPAPLGPAFPGCTAYMAPEMGFWLNVSFTGTADWDIYVPFIPSLSGESFYMQAGVLVPGYIPGGLVFSNAVHATFGI